MTVEVKDLPQLAEELKKRTDEVKAIAEEFNGKAAKGEKLSQDAKDAADVAMTKLNELRAQTDILVGVMADLNSSGIKKSVLM